MLHDFRDSNFMGVQSSQSAGGVPEQARQGFATDHHNQQSNLQNPSS
jgi:hypothetical protein